MKVTEGVIEEQQPRTELGSAGCCAGEHRSSEPRSSEPRSSEHRSSENRECCGHTADSLSRSATVSSILHSGTARSPGSAESEAQARMYEFILRVAAETFELGELCRLVPPKRGPIDLKRNLSPQLGAADSTATSCDPIAFTEAVAYEFLARGGKQARPFMTLATYVALGTELGQRSAQATLSSSPSEAWLIPDHVKRVAISIESFHKASLVHDDIEDQDEYRYGQPTLHCRFGVASAINVGDYLIGMGYRLVSHDAAILGSESAADLLDILAEAHQRLCEGQGAELYWRDALDKQLRPDDALQIYALKTSPAFEAALMCGARLRGALETYRDAFRRFARHVGIAFQVLNDLKDWESDEGNKKSIGADLIEGRPTVLWALALEKLPPPERELLLQLPCDTRSNVAERIEQARKLYLQADVFNAARDLVIDQRAAASAVAREFSEGAMRQLLEYIIETVINRPHGLVPLSSP